MAQDPADTPEVPDGVCVTCVEKDVASPNKVWYGSEDYCFMHDPSDRAKERRKQARQAGGDEVRRRAKLQQFPLDADDVDLETYEGQRQFLSELAKGLINAGTFLDNANDLRKIAKDCRDLTDKIRKEEDLRGRLEKLERKLKEARDD